MVWKHEGARTIVATNRRDRWFFLYGFGKNERATIEDRELKAFQDLASDYLAPTDAQIDHTLTHGLFSEIGDGHHKTPAVACLRPCTRVRAICTASV
jgi:hypothetical protein